MKFNYPKIIICALVILLQIEAYSESSMYLSINDTGNLDAAITLNNPNLIKFFFIPFAINKSDEIRVSAAGDVIVKAIFIGANHSILNIISSPLDSTAIFKIENIAELGENIKGEGYFELNISYPLLSANEKLLMLRKETISKYDISIELPEQYDETLVNTEQFYKVQNKIFSVSKSKLLDPKIEKAWIVFPNPMANKNRFAKIVFSFFAGCFLLLFHVPAFRQRNIKWSIIVFISSLILMIVAIYFTFKYPKGFDFAIGTVGAIPHVLYGLGTSLYFFVDKIFGASIIGKIMVEGTEIRLAEIILFEVLSNGDVKELSKKSELNEGGRYAFYLKHWKREKKKYKLGVTSRLSKDFLSYPFELEVTKKHEEIINLEKHTLPNTATNAHNG